MRIKDEDVKNRILSVLSDGVCVAMLGRMVNPMSVKQVSEEFGIPLSSAYRYISLLRDAGLIIVKTSVVRETGAKYNLYESALRMVSIVFKEGSMMMDVVPNKDAADRFMSFWRKLGEE